MNKQYRTTTGNVNWNDDVEQVDKADDPIQPDGDCWTLIGSTISEIYRAHQTIFWFWCRDIS